MLGTFNLTDKDNRMIDLRLGDCLEVMKTIEDNSIDAIITDPPYGTTACKWDSVIDFGLMWEQLNRIIKPNGAIVLFGNQPFTSVLISSNLKMFSHCWVWEKNTCSNFLLGGHRPLLYMEDIVIFSNGKFHVNSKNRATYNPILKKGVSAIVKDKEQTKGFREITGRPNPTILKTKNRDGLLPKNIIKFDAIKKKQHPTQKPVPLMAYLIKTYTNEGETVLDFTMGSGSTGVACKQSNRNFIGIEKEQKYFKIAQERINSTLF